MVGTTVGSYRILDKLGEGGMGIVYLGEHELLGRRAAIKVLHPELVRSEDAAARFFMEARAVNAIRHENIVDVVDFGRTPAGDSFFVMEWLEGQTLAERLREGRLDPALAVDIAVQAAAALSAAHAQGIVHRDLKPDNLFLTSRAGRQNFVKILDFGIAKLVSQPAAHKTRSGAIVGTAQYMAPEQCQSKGEIDGRADVYALGLILYEMLSGRPAFDEGGFTETLIAQTSRPPVPPREVNPFIPEALETVVLRCLRKDKELRYASMEELIGALGPFVEPASRAARADLPTKPLRPAPPTRAETRTSTLGGSATEMRRVARRRRALLAAGAGVAAAVGIFLWLVGSPQGPTAVAPMAVVTPPPLAPRVRVSIRSTPAGAAIRRVDNGESLGETPLEWSIVRSHEPVALEATQAGHAAQRTTVVPDHDQTVDLALVAVPPPITPPAKPIRRVASRPRPEPVDPDLVPP
jgi:eukaryotic-like serine/threonine-protein kinase